ncbi:glycosyltransferase [Kosakonia cowanii]|jgi:GT2 family glycosyltransferase|uniref:glycosyltransferase n=1 Tax=Kosakonia cowanii TaxID=208223 RepID=UPI00289CE7E7|nr:glycosyltransferase [Kosakonia cowanii]
MKISLLVIIYNEKIVDTTTYLSLKSALPVINSSPHQYNIIFWDNSPLDHLQNSVADIKNDFKGSGVSCEYHHTPQNVPLAEIYNALLNKVENSDDYLVLFDQDSTFEPGFFDELHKSIELGKQPEIILPVIYFKNTIISPTKIFFIKGSYFDTKPTGYISHNISAINSGMVISLEFIRRTGFRYNSKLRNYCTDDDIMKSARDNFAIIYVMDYSFAHDLTLSTLNSNSDKLRERYNEMIKSKKIVFAKNIATRLFLHFYYFSHRVYMSLKYKDWRYMKAE